ncbi:MAG: hypothetical protein HZB41_06310 [Ignavibacteriae bacterium]|nr:hypothetical protein [Ignavibacteriota bacterium]
MKKTKENTDSSINDELLPEYNIDYSKAKRNPYYKKNRTYIELDEEVANYFQSPEQVNNILKAIIKSVRKKPVAV